jgi:predicted oxidoreductase
MKTYIIPGTDIETSRIAYGTGYLGGSWDNLPLDSRTIRRGVRLIHTAYDQGITLFDLADAYCLGKSDLVFAEALRTSPQLRTKITLQSKCGIRWPVGADSDDIWYMDLSYRHIINSVEGSLRRLGTDYLDILLLHHPDPLMQPAEIAAAFDDLERSGKVRYFGISNHNSYQISLLQRHVRKPLVVNQILVGLSNPDAISEGGSTTLSVSTQSDRPTAAPSGTLEYCMLNGLQIQAYSPLRGLPLHINDQKDLPIATKKLAQILWEIARDRKSHPSAIALAWLLNHPMNIQPVMQSQDADRLIANCTAERIELTRLEWYELWCHAAEARSNR